MSARNENRHISVVRGWVAGLGLTLATACLPAGPVLAQVGLDLDDGTHPAAAPPPPALSLPNLDLPTTATTNSHDGIVDGIRTVPNGNDPGGDKLIPHNTALTNPTNTATTQPGETTPAAQPAGNLPPPINIDNPKVITTARLSGNGRTVSLFGITGLDGEAAQQLEAYLTGPNAHLICPAQTSSDYVCTLPDGTDVAAIALANGAARARDDAPEGYKAQEAVARDARRGIWAALPPPPDGIVHPTFTDTATMVSGDKKFVLDGVIGLGQPYVGKLQGYIQANGDQVTCQPQGVPGHFICILPNGTDIAKVALVNGAARVGPDAPDTYRLEQLDALNNHRGFWLHPPANFAAADTRPAGNTCCVFVAGDDGTDGIAYVGGEPTAVIDGQTVFLVLAGAAGWGYYDRDRHWHDAPDSLRRHLERYHPNGQGLRAYRATGGNSANSAVAAGGRAAGGAQSYRPAAPIGGGRPATFATHASLGADGYNGFGGGFVRPTSPVGGFLAAVPLVVLDALARRH